MKATINTTIEQQLLSRKEIKATVVFEGAVPSRKDIAKELAAKSKTEPSLLVVFGINPKFGAKEVAVLAYAYDNKESLARIEEKKKFKRTGHAEEKAAVVEGAQ